MRAKSTLKEMPKVGDKVRYLGGDCDDVSSLTIGGIYEIEGDVGDGDAYFIDDVGDRWGLDEDVNDNFAYYELVTEPQPDVSDLIANLGRRLSEVEAELEQMKDDGDTSKHLRIALCGQLRAGKDAVADYLYDEHDFALPIAFGTALKRFAHEIYPDVPLTPKPRGLYQFMNVMREYDPDVWIKQVAKEMVQLDGESIVITDVRQQNERDWCKDNGFTIVRVTAPEDIRMKRAQDAGDVFTAESLTHKTESHVNSFDVDYEIENSGTIAELHAKVNELLAEVGV